MVDGFRVRWQMNPDITFFSYTSAVSGDCGRFFLTFSNENSNHDCNVD